MIFKKWFYQSPVSTREAVHKNRMAISRVEDLPEHIEGDMTFEELVHFLGVLYVSLKRQYEEMSQLKRELFGTEDVVEREVSVFDELYKEASTNQTPTDAFVTPPADPVALDRWVDNGGTHPWMDEIREVEKDEVERPKRKVSSRNKSKSPRVGKGRRTKPKSTR